MGIVWVLILQGYTLHGVDHIPMKTKEACVLAARHAEENMAICLNTETGEYAK